MSFLHKSLEMMSQEEHTHVGDNDEQTGAKKVVEVGNYATKITKVGLVTYIAIAAPGTAQATAKWQAQKVDNTTGTVITWADKGNFSQISTDLTTLVYA